MAKGKINLLLVEDNPADAGLITELLEEANPAFVIRQAKRLGEAVSLMQNGATADAVLLDLGLPDSQGLDTFVDFRKTIPEPPLIILSGLDDVHLSMQAVSQGAQDYLLKNQITGELLARSIQHAIERDRLDRNLRESEERYRTLLEVTPDAILVHADGKVKYANDAAVRLLKANDKEQLIDYPIMDLVHPDYREIVAERVKQVIETKKVQPPLEERLICFDGSEIYVEISGSYLVFEGQAASQVVARNITERKQHQRELEAIAAISRNLRAANTRDEMLPIIRDQALALLDGEAVTIILKHANQESYFAALASGPWEKAQGLHFDFLGEAAQELFRSGKPYLYNESRSNPDPAVIPPPEGARMPEAHISVPLATENRIVGFISVAREAPFSQQHIRLLTSIANIAGNAIHRADLFEQTQRRLQRLNALREVDTAIAANLDVSYTLEVLLKEAREQLHVDACNVLLLDQTQTLEHAAAQGFQSGQIKHTRLRLGEGHAGNAALKRELVRIPDFSKDQMDFTRKELVKDEGFESYHAAPLVVKGKVIGVLEAFHRAKLYRDNEWEDFFMTLAGQAAIAIDNGLLFENLQRSNQELQLAYDRTIEGWAHALSLRDLETIDHSRRVTEMAVDLARVMGMSEEQLVHVRRGALLHDIGKMSIPDHILGKAGPLNDEEWEIMRKHPLYAYEMLNPIPFLHPAIPIPVCHHEKWDGSGYPEKRAKEDIPLEARVFAIIDVWDALTSDRPYRAAWSREKAQKYIREQSAIHFDPQVVDAFFKHILGQK